MKLRNQIFIISLFLFLLPWGGWQYLKSVDSVLRNAQAQSLLDNVKLTANRLSADLVLFDKPFISVVHKENYSANSVYAYPLSTPPTIDGYNDEWRDLPIDVIDLISTPTKPKSQLRVAQHQEKFYFYLNVKDKDIKYYNPVLKEASQSDHLQLTLFDSNGKAKKYFIRTSAPSRISAHYYDQKNDLKQELDIEGVWQENKSGYQIEWAINKDLLLNGFYLRIIDKQTDKVEIIDFNDQKSFLIGTSSEIEKIVEKFHSPNLDLKILNSEYWLIASVKSKETPITKEQNPWIIEWFYRKLLESNQFSLRDRNLYRSYKGDPEVIASQKEGSALTWYELNDSLLKKQTLVSAAAPIYDGKKIQGYLILEKTTDQLITQTTSAFWKLFIYTMGASLLVAFILLFYISWLSFRVSRLHNATNQAIDQTGSVTSELNNWPDIKNKDELGSLSRAYRDLLQRIDGYHQYLRTLSSKLSHELRTPIAVVRSSLDNLVQVSENEKRQEYVDRAQEGIQRLNNILNAMSAAASVEQSIVDADFSQINLHNFLNQLTSVYQDIYYEHPFVFNSNNKNITANISEELFIQMLDKLVNNATEFSPQGETISLQLQQNKSHAIIKIENTGPLLPDKMQDSIFDSMITLRERKKSTNTHLGLGLYIAKLIVEAHQGQITARNRVDNKGVIFIVTLPSCVQ